MPKKSKESKSRNYTTKSSSSEGQATTKKPLVSTGKKIGIAMYFTFLATLALVMGAQILANDVFGGNNTQDSQPNLAPQTQTTTEYQDQQPQYDQQTMPSNEDIDPNFYVEQSDSLINNNYDNQSQNNSYVYSNDNLENGYANNKSYIN